MSKRGATEMSQPSIPVEVFCSYAHEDEQQLQKLEAHLSLLKRQGLISTWNDRHIVPGVDWAHAIDTHLNSASVILLLISSDFLSSEYGSGIEIQRAMERHEANEARVIPILLRPVDWQSAPFGRLQVLPTNAKPITTWSNHDEAWADVVAAIRRSINDLPRLAVSTPLTVLPRVWNIPYPRNPVFTGREELLECLAKSLRTGQMMALTQPLGISGLGGIGKTQLAVEYAYKYHFNYQAVLWALAEDREALIRAFVAIAALLKLPEEKDKQEDLIVVNAVKEWMRIHTQWLLILDNADDLAIIPEFLPPNYGGHILLTTRAQAMGRLAKRVEVDTLTPDVGAHFLLRRAGLLMLDTTPEQGSPYDHDMAKQITKELGGLPLALDQAGAYIEETGCGLADYQQLYQHHRAELLKERRGLIADHPESVATTVSLAVSRVEQNNPAAAELLRLCAFLAPDAIPEEIIVQGAAHLGPFLDLIAADAFLLNQAFESLRASSLMQHDLGRKMLSIHRLVQAVLQDAMSTETRKQWLKNSVQVINAMFPAINTFVAWFKYTRYLPHAQSVLAHAEQLELNSTDVISLRNQVKFYKEIERALHDVPENIRLPLLLAEVGGFSFTEIAMMLEISVSESRRRLSRGRKFLQQAVLTLKKEHLL